jgi:hypothetical protein
MVDARPEPVPGEIVEETIRCGAVAIIRAFHGLLGKVLAELIAEGQSDPAIVRKLFDEHIRDRRAADAAEIERTKANGQLMPDTDPEVLLDAVFGAIYYRFLLRSAPLTEQYGADLVRQVFNGVRARPKLSRRASPKKTRVPGSVARDSQIAAKKTAMRSRAQSGKKADERRRHTVPRIGTAVRLQESSRGPRHQRASA